MDVVDELLVFLLRPSSLVHVSLIAARLPHHFAFEEEKGEARRSKTRWRLLYICVDIYVYTMEDETSLWPECGVVVEMHGGEVNEEEDEKG